MKRHRKLFCLALVSCAHPEETAPAADGGSPINLILRADPISLGEVAPADGFLYLPYNAEVEISVYDEKNYLRDAEYSWQVTPDFSFELTPAGRHSRVAYIKAVDDPLSFGGIEPSAELTVNVKDQNGNEGELKTRVVSVVNLNGSWQGDIIGVEYNWYLNIYQQGKTFQIGDFGRGRRYDGIVNGIFVEFTAKGDYYFEQFLGTVAASDGMYGFHNIESDSCLAIWALTR